MANKWSWNDGSPQAISKEVVIVETSKEPVGPRVE